MPDVKYGAHEEENFLLVLASRLFFFDIRERSQLPFGIDCHNEENSNMTRFSSTQWGAVDWYWFILISTSQVNRALLKLNKSLLFFFELIESIFCKILFMMKLF